MSPVEPEFVQFAIGVIDDGGLGEDAFTVQASVVKDAERAVTIYARAGVGDDRIGAGARRRGL